MKNKSLFSLGPLFNPIYLIDKLINSFTHSQQVSLSGNPVYILWTNRADKKLQQNKNSITIEMQLYFSCVVKKRVIFHSDKQEYETTRVNDKFEIAFHTVEAASCDPVEFAQNFPAKRILNAESALKMRPRELKFDYKNHNWEGEFTI